VKRTIKATAVIAVLAVLLARPLSAGIHQVWDEAHFFKPETIVQVDQMLAGIHEKFHKDLMIETFASIPDDFKQKYQQDGKEKFFENWAASEGASLQLNGLIILVCGDPRHIQIELGKATRQKAFTEADRDELLRILTASFRSNDFDKGMISGAQFVHDRMEKNLTDVNPPTTRPASQSGQF
jgi:uncharacterized membrane protein YgcG